MEKSTLSTLRSIADLPGPKARPLLGNVRDIRARPFHQVLES